MAGNIVGGGIQSWGMSRDREGHREYKCIHLIRMDSILDGPALALQTPGLPAPGDTWSFGNDLDVYAWCRPDATVRSVIKKGDKYFEIDQTFSTKPDDRRCQDNQIEDPLLEPDKVSGSFVKYTEEATRAKKLIYRRGTSTIQTKTNARILSSSFEQIRGPQVDFPASRPTVRIQQNVPTLGIETFAPMIDTLNGSSLWGFPPRCISLVNVPWEEVYYNLCLRYYVRTLEFEIFAKEDPDNPGSLISGFDRTVFDEGTKALSGRWNGDTWDLVKLLDDDGFEIASPNPDKDDPSHYFRIADKQGNTVKMLLDGEGKPVTGTNADPGEIEIQKAEESNFLLLGVPSTIPPP